MGGNARQALEAALARAKAQGSLEDVAEATKALEAFDSKTGRKAPAAKPEQEQAPPPAEGPGFVRRGLNSFWNQLGREGSAITDYFGITDPTTPERQARQRELDTFAIRAANAFGLSIPDAIVNAAEPRGAEGAARDYRRRLYGDPVNKTAGQVGDIAGAVGSAVMGPARLAGGALRMGAKAVANAAGKVTPRVIGGADAARKVTQSTPVALGAGAAEGVGVNAAQNAIDPDAAELLQQWEVPAAFGLLGPVLGKAAALANRGLIGRKDSPTRIGQYRDYVDSGRSMHDVDPATGPRIVPADSTPERARVVENADFPKLPPHPNDVFQANAARGRAPEMRDVRDAAEEAGGQAIQHRATSAKRVFDALEAEAAPFQEIRSPRQALIDDIDQQIAANRDPNLGTVSARLEARLQHARDRLVQSTPAKKPVIEPSRSPTEQVELPSPGAPARTLPPEPMSTPAAAPAPAQQRVMFADEPGQALGSNDTDHKIRALLASARRDAEAAQAAVPPLPNPRSTRAARNERAAASQEAFRARAQEGEAKRLANMKPFVKVEPDPGPPPIEPPMRFEAADPAQAGQLEALRGQQLEIQSPTPRTQAAIDPVPGPGPYQRSLPLGDEDQVFRSAAEALGDPTIGGLRRLRTEARSRANFANKNPTPQELEARDEYFIWDRAIKRAAETNAPQYLDIEGRMAAEAKKFRRAGDIMRKTERNLTSGGGGTVDELTHVSPDELGAIVDEDAVEGAATAAARPRGVGRNRVRSGDQQAVATFMQRFGDENTPGKNSRAGHEELSDLDPEYARLQQLVQDVKSVEAVTPGLKSQVPLDLHGASTKVGGTSMSLLLQNLRAIGARLPPVLQFVEKTAPRAGQLGLALRDPLDAILELKRREFAEREKQKARQDGGKAVSKR